MACFPCRRRNLDCNPQCAFLETFSKPNQEQQFEAVEFVFGFDKVQRIMQEVPEEKRQAYIRSIVVEAVHRRQDLTTGFPGMVKKQIRELLSEREEAKREISQLQQEKSEWLGKTRQLQEDNAEALGKILLLQRDKEEAFENIQRLLKEKEESKRVTKDQILQLRQTLKEDFEKYLIRIEQLFHQQATGRTTHPDEPAINLLHQEFAGASAAEPRVGVEQQPRPPVDLSFSLKVGSPHHGVIAPAVITDPGFSVNPSADEQHPSTSSMLPNLDLPPSGKRQRVNSEQ